MIKIDAKINVLKIDNPKLDKQIIKAIQVKIKLIILITFK